MEERAIAKQKEADDLKLVCDKLNDEAQGKRKKKASDDPLGLFADHADPKPEENRQQTEETHGAFFDACMRSVRATQSCAPYMAASQKDRKF